MCIVNPIGGRKIRHIINTFVINTVPDLLIKVVHIIIITGFIALIITILTLFFTHYLSFGQS